MRRGRRIPAEAIRGFGKNECEKKKKGTPWGNPPSCEEHSRRMGEAVNALGVGDGLSQIPT